MCIHFTFRLYVYLRAYENKDITGNAEMNLSLQFHDFFGNLPALYDQHWSNDGVDIEILSSSSTLEESSIKMSLYHVYDNFLSPDYGAYRDGIKNVVAQTAPDFFNSIQIIPINILVKEPMSFFQIMLRLFEFLTKVSDKTHGLLECGNLTHSTKLLFSKFPQGVRCLHVNTGLGFNEAAPKVKNNTCYNLFTELAFVSFKRLPEFCNFIKPIVFQTVVATRKFYALQEFDRKTVYDTCMSGKPSGFFSALRTPNYDLMYSNIFVKENGYFDAIRACFAQFVDDIGDLGSVDNANFIQKWEENAVSIYDETKRNAYFTKAAQNIVLVNEGNVIYMRPQQSGSCAYMSLIAACIALCVLPQPNTYYTAESFVTFYNTISMTGYDTISRYSFKPDNFNFTSATILIQKLVEDSILIPDNNYYKLQFADNFVTTRKFKTELVRNREPTFQEIRKILVQIRDGNTITEDTANQDIIRWFSGIDYSYNYVALCLLLLIYKRPELINAFKPLSENINWQLFITFEITEDENKLMSKMGSIEPSFKGSISSIISSKFVNQYQYYVDKRYVICMFHAMEEYYTCLFPFLNKHVLDSPQKVTTVLVLKIGQTLSYVPTYIRSYFCKLTLQSSGLFKYDDICEHIELFMLSAGLFYEEERKDIASLLLQRFAENWNFSDTKNYNLLCLVNYIHKTVRISADKKLPKTVAQTFLQLNQGMEEVHIANPKQVEHIVGVVKHFINKDDNLLNIETFANSNIGKQSSINNKMFKFAKDSIKLMYNVSKDTWIASNDIDIMHNTKSYIIMYLKETGKFFTCTNDGKNYLLCILPRNSYKNGKMLSEDLLIEFETTQVGTPSVPKTSDFSQQDTNEIDLSKIRINGNPVTCVFPICNYTVLQSYPFLCTMPQTCLKFININKDNNSVKVYLVQHNSENGYLGNAVFSEHKYKNTHFLLELQIKQNFLLPVLSAKQLKYLKQMVENSNGCMVGKVHNPINKNVSLEELRTLTARNVCPQLPSLTVFDEITNLLGWQEHPQETACAPFLDELTVSVISKLNKSIQEMEIIRSNKSKEINFTQENMFQIFTENDAVLFQLLQSNMRITTLMRIKQLFEKWLSLNCYELLELKDLLKNYEACSISKIDAAFQIALGLLIRKEQWEKYYEIMETFVSKTCKIFQFMMAKGKSSVITPMLLHYFTYISTESILHVVIPSHLKNEVITTMSEYNRLLNIPVNVLTDTDFKLSFLRYRNEGAPPRQENEHGGSATLNSKSIFLFDEIDDMYDATKSTFNVVKKQMHLDAELVKNIFKTTANFLFGAKVHTNIKVLSAYTTAQLQAIVTNDGFKKNVHYGMSNICTDRVCIPYEKRLDSPMEGSRFASPLYTLAFTAKYFFQKETNGFVLYKEDIKKICNWTDEDGNALVVALMNEWAVKYDSKKTFETLLFLMFQGFPTKSVSINIMRTYFNKIISGLLVSSETYNCSFVDVMNLNSEACLWAVGYSGTVQMNLEVTTENQRFQKEIVPDPDEEKGVAQALGNAEIINIASAQSVWDVVRTNNFTAIIDACALFEQYNNDEVAKHLYETSGEIKKEVVYVRRDDTKMSYGPAGPYPYVDRFRPAGSVIYFYSQRHIIGVDFKQQPPYLNGLLLLGPQTTRTQAAQAMYRLRKLNKGHVISVGVCFNLTIPEGSNVLKVLQTAEDFEQRSKNTLLGIQYIKFLARHSKLASDNAYQENPDTNINLLQMPDVSPETVYNQLNIALKTENIENNEHIGLILLLLTSSAKLKYTIGALYNTGSSVETAIISSTETSTSTSTSASTAVNAAQFVASRHYAMEMYFNRTTIWDWTTDSTDVRCFFSLQNGLDTIYISRNVTKHSNFSPRAYFLVQIAYNKFLLEPADLLPLYLCCGKPLINMFGTIINNGEPYLTRTYPESAKPNKLLHMLCTYSTHAFPFWQIFSLSPPKRTEFNSEGVMTSITDTPLSVAVNKETFSKLAYLFRFCASAQHLQISVTNCVAFNLAWNSHIFDTQTPVAVCRQRNTALICNPSDDVDEGKSTIPSTHSCKGLYDLYAWKDSKLYGQHYDQELSKYAVVVWERVCKDIVRTLNIQTPSTDYGIIVKRNMLQQNNILQHLVRLTDVLSIPLSSRPLTLPVIAPFSLDINASIEYLNVEVIKLTELLNRQARLQKPT